MGEEPKDGRTTTRMRKDRDKEMVVGGRATGSINENNTTRRPKVQKTMGKVDNQR